MNMNKYEKCISCKQRFTDNNVHTDAGWRETQISGLCEDCFDGITLYDEDVPDGDISIFESEE